MDIRKIQATGGASLSITLPKKWITKMNLKDKDEVIVTEQRTGDIILRSKKFHVHTKKGTLNITKANYPNIRRYIASIYKIGIDELTIKSALGVDLDKSSIRKVASKLMGWEIVKDGEGFVVLQNVLDMSRVPISQTLKQLFSQSREMLIDAGKIILKADDSLAKDIIERDDEADKLCLLIERAYLSVLTGRISEEEIGYSSRELGYFRDVAVQLERICDHTVKMAKITQLDKTENDFEELEKILEKLVYILSELEVLVTSEEATKTNEISKKIKLLKKETFFGAQDVAEHKFTEILLQDSLNRIRAILDNISEDITDQIVMRHYR